MKRAFIMGMLTIGLYAVSCDEDDGKTSSEKGLSERADLGDAGETDSDADADTDTEYNDKSRFVTHPVPR